MNRVCTLLAGFGLGVGVGVVYFTGLWFTVRRAVVSSNPQLLLRLSRMGRQLATLTVMAMVIRFDPVMFLALMPGFLVGRFLVGQKVTEGQGGKKVAAAPLDCSFTQPSE